LRMTWKLENLPFNFLRKIVLIIYFNCIECWFRVRLKKESEVWMTIKNEI
jgi:hypothetical protein